MASAKVPDCVGGTEMEEWKVGRQMKKLIFVACLVLTGCASGTPIDFIWPTVKDNATDKVLGDDAPKASFVPWHTLADSKAEKAAIDPKIQEWIARGELAKKNTGQVVSQNNAISVGLWGVIVAGVGLLGWQIPRPQEGKKVVEALHKQPPSSA
jgi:hypothetical protein